MAYENPENEELSEYERQILRNIAENRRQLIELGLLNESPNEERNSVRFNGIANDEKKKRKRSSPTFHVARKIDSPIFRRRSARLNGQDGSAYFSKEVLYCICDESAKGTDVMVNIIIDDEIIDSPSEKSDSPSEKSAKKPRNHNSAYREILAVEDVTEDHISNIASSSTGKTYSQDGTTCHQCRQKTLDQKTVCRSETCFGVRGQFCGPCLKNRYGECVAEALRDENWNCPPCRDICNCSICRTQNGKVPTGALAPYAQKEGYTSVKALLEEEEKE